ncbi:MAG: exodeoxyribonuclease VII small subunit [Bacteroidaceae bacterium]
MKEMKKQIPTYKEAIDQLEKIIAKIDSNEVEIDTLVEDIKQANDLISLCRAKLNRADEEVQKLWSEKQTDKE